MKTISNILLSSMFIQTWGKIIAMLAYCIVIIFIAINYGVPNAAGIIAFTVLIFIGIRLSMAPKQPTMEPTHLIVDEIREKIIYAGNQHECEVKYNELNDVGYRIININEYKLKNQIYEMVEKIVLEREKK